MTWKISLQNLKDKLGVTSQMKLFRFNIKKITETNHLPEYNVTMDDDIVMFTRKEPPKENKAPDKLSKHVSKKRLKIRLGPVRVMNRLKSGLRD